MQADKPNYFKRHPLEFLCPNLRSRGKYFPRLVYHNSSHPLDTAFSFKSLHVA